MSNNCSHAPINFREIRKHYRFEDEDKKNLQLMAPIAVKCADEFIIQTLEFIRGFNDFAKYLPNETILKEHEQKLKNWFVTLFDSNYDDNHLEGLFKIGLRHLQIGLPPHYVHATISFVRDFINSKISETFDDRHMRESVRSSCSKMLDMNLDVIAMSYREAELRPFLVSGKFQRWLITSMEKFSFSMDVILSAFLVLISFMIMGDAAYQIFAFLDGKATADATVMDVLGTLLILWAISELLQEGIKHLRGGQFAIASFVGLGLAASIREILIASLNHDVSTIGVLTFTVLALGAVYYLLNKSKK